MSTPWYIVCSDQFESVSNTQLNLRKYLVILVCSHENFPRAFGKGVFTQSWFQVKHEIRICKARMVVSLALWTHLSGHRGDGKVGKHHPAESSLWISPALPRWVPPGSVFSRHTFFPGHSSLFLGKTMLLLPKHKYFTCLWMASATATCLWESLFKQEWPLLKDPTQNWVPPS